MPGGLISAQKRMWDPFLSLMAAAQATTRLRIGTAVALPLERELFTFAKEVATLDQFSDGRLLLGVGVGLPSRIRGVAIDPVGRSLPGTGRHGGCARQVVVQKDESEYHGEFYDFGPVSSHPKPQQRPRPPLLAAATGPKATRDCLPWADGR